MAETRWTCETASLVFCWQTPGETSHVDLAREDVPNQVAQARTRTVLGTPTIYHSHLSVSRVIIQDEHRIGGTRGVKVMAPPVQLGRIGICSARSCSHPAPAHAMAL